jgi:hypothetical protein
VPIIHTFLKCEYSFLFLFFAFNSAVAFFKTFLGGVFLRGLFGCFSQQCVTFFLQFSFILIPYSPSQDLFSGSCLAHLLHSFTGSLGAASLCRWVLEPGRAF